MIKVKMFKRASLIMVLSIACATSMGCSDTKKPEQEQTMMEEQTEEIIIDNSESSTEESKNSETEAFVTPEASTVPPSTQELPAQNLETSSIPSTDRIGDSSATKLDTAVVAANSDIVQSGDTKTIDGYETVDGASLPITATFGIADIQRGENAYATLQNSNADLPAPGDGMEYLVVTLNVTYDKGEADILDLSENNASMVSEKRFFALSNGDSNAEQMTANLSNSIYNLSIKKGEQGQGAVAFLHKADSTEPLNFIGFGNVIKFNIAN